MLKEKKKKYTPEEYLAIEEAAEYKSEYYNSEIFALAGASPNHNRITGNLYTALNLDQDEIHIEYFHKGDDGRWVLDEYKSIDEMLKLNSVQLEIPIKDIYDRVEWKEDC